MIAQFSIICMLTFLTIADLYAQPTIASISDITVNEETSIDLLGAIDVSSSGTLVSVVITSVSNETQTLNSSNSGKQVDPFPKTADDFISENIVLSDANNYDADLTILAPFGAGGMDASGTGSYTVTVTATDNVGSVTETFEITVVASYKIIAATGKTLIEAESFFNQGPVNSGSGNNGIGVEIDPLGFTNIGFTTAGDFVEYLLDIPQDGAYEFDFQISKGSGPVTYGFDINGEEVFADIEPTGGWTTFVSKKASVFLSAGQQVVRFDWTGSGNYFFNIDNFTVELLPNQAPTIEEITEQTNANEDVISGLFAVANDIENHNITYSDGGTLPTGLSINGISGEITGTIDANASASSPFTVVITATDDGSPMESGTTTFQWVVVPTIDNPPSIDPISDIEIAETGTATVNIQVNDDMNPSATIKIYDISNGSGNPSFGTAINPSNYTFTDNTGGSYTLSWTTNLGDAKAYQAVVTANDGANPEVIEVFDIDVAADLPGTVQANTFSEPLPWYGSSNPGAGYSVAIESNTEQNIGYIGAGEYVEYLVNVPAGTYQFSINAANGSGTNGSSTNISLSEENGGGFSEIGSIDVPKTDWTNFLDFTVDVNFASGGIQTIRLDFDGGVNVDYFSFMKIHTITATAGANGAISPIGNIEVEEGDDAIFDITPDLGFEIDELTIDGNLVSNNTQYTFFNVTGDHTIDVTFKATSGVTYDIMSSAGPNGNIDPIGVTTVLENGSQSYTITPDFGFKIADVLVDGISVGSVSSYDFMNVNANATIAATFEFDAFYVNCGGPALSTGGIDFSADFGSSAGTPYPNLGSAAATTLAGIDFANTTDDELFRTERYGDYTYDFNVPNGSYIVDLYIAEIYQGVLNAASNAVPGKRIFDVEVEGTTVLDDLDLLNPEQGGVLSPTTGLVKSFVVNVSDGFLTIETTKSVDNAKLSAICIRADDGSVNTAPILTPVTNFQVTAGDNAEAALIVSEPVTELIVEIVESGTAVPEASYSINQISASEFHLLFPTTLPDVGTYSVTVLAFDGQDVGSTTFDFTVIENMKPVITLNGDNPMNIEVGDTYTEPEATAFDDEDGVIDPSNIVIGGDVVNTSSVGTFFITYDVNDSNGVPADQVIRTVNVTDPADSEAPVITLLGDNPLDFIVGETYVEPGATALDNIDGDISGNIVIDISALDMNTIGSYMVTYNVSDAALNAAIQVSRTVNVSAIPEPSCANSLGGFRVNCGGPTGFGANGTFEEDQATSATGGTAVTGTPSPYFDISNGDNTYGSNSAFLNNTGYPDDIFKTERYQEGDQNWSFPANGTYEVRLLFNENWANENSTAANNRIFDIVIEGNLVADDYRPSVVAGGAFIAKVETYSVTVTDGILNIDLLQVNQNPSLKGIDICFVSGPANNAPVVSISSPSDNGTEIINSLLTFTGSVTDVEDDDNTITSNLLWTSDIEGVIGTGGTFDFAGLSLGAHVITASVTDAGGLVGEASINLIISNTNTPPVLTIDSPIDGSNVTRGSSFSLTATASDNEDGDISHMIAWTTDDTGELFAPVSGIGNTVDLLLVRPGTTIVTATITDTDNNMVTETITLNVSAPEISLLQPLDGAILNSRTVTFEINPVGVIPDNVEHYHFYLNPNDINDLDEDKRISTASDPFQTSFVFDENSGSLSVNIPGNGITSGSNTVVVFAADQFHNQFSNAEASDTVTFDVVDNTIPVITLLGDNPLELQIGDTYIEAGANATDDFDGDISANIIIDDSALDMNTAGSYAITYNVEDAEGNEADEVVRTVNVSALDGIPQVLFEITPGTPIGGTTYGSTDKFQITNQSTGSVRITKFTIDLSTAILPDMVFDPVGAGGDATAQCFNPDPTKATTVGLTPLADPCIDPFLAPREGGFDIVTMDFTDFNPAENFSFSVDIDPNSIQGVPGAGFAGAVSGLELVGATITVEFENGYTIVSNLYEDGSFGGAQVIGPSNLPAPTLQASGTITNPSTAYNASQEIIICGQANAYYSLLQIDARLHIASGAPPYNVPDPTFYANELVDKVVYNGQFDSQGKATIIVPLLLTAGTGGEPDGGLNYFMAVQSDQPYAVNTAVSSTSDPILLLYVDDPVLSDLTGTVTVINALSQSFDATISLYQGSSLINSYQVTTNSSGEFLIPGILPGNYDFWVKNSKTLAVLVNGTLNPGSNSIDFGGMVSGDFQDDNDVDIIDFSGYANSYGLVSGDPGYSSQADFNFNNSVDIIDFSLFANGYGMIGAGISGVSGKTKNDDQTSLSMADAEFSVALSDHNPTVDDIIDVSVSVDEVNIVNTASQFHLVFNEEILEVIDITYNQLISDGISDIVDSKNGVITFEMTKALSGNEIEDIVIVSFRMKKASSTNVMVVGNNAFKSKSIKTKAK
ncbi:hypothetical protein GCM10007940_40670 [Portibacter lacus]|uniref:DUF5011 domain-containing protein n=2 Tax=Portibacter lacus TaxID=1099794 RepID=A0AA37WF34_9BACT|nr:hypothetical protein GCM10007940_40670 [Portibacter lacus]